MKTPKPRTTLAKIIEAPPDAGKTDFAELYGRRLTKLESCCHVFLHCHSHLPEINENDKDFCRELGMDGTDKERCLKLFSDSKMLLCIELLQAILNRDCNALRSLASFIEKWTYLKSPVDKMRWEILLLKKRCELAGRKMKIKEVADYLNRKTGKNDPIKTVDGLAALRRLCKKMKFPIVPDAKGRPRKKETSKA